MDKKLAERLQEVSAAYGADEKDVLPDLASYVEASRVDFDKAKKNAVVYVENIRKNMEGVGIEAFFGMYGLDSDEGLAVMTLAESLLRIPDSVTANDLIHDKLAGTQWNKHKEGGSLVMRLSSVGMKLAGKIFSMGEKVSYIADPVIRESIRHSMKFLGEHFVMGQNTKKAFDTASQYEKAGYTVSYDMLGEAARTSLQAEQYFQKYYDVIDAIKPQDKSSDDIFNRNGVSIKLSALYPRYDYLRKEDVIEKLLPNLKKLIKKAADKNISVTIDAEESARLDLTLEIFTILVCDEELKSFEELGIVIQAYHKHAFKVCEYIVHLAKSRNKMIPVRLVKGAYWDSEIKKAQVLGLNDYPVFCHKDHTDISYLACAYLFLKNNDVIYPQFATHNAMTVAEVEQAASGKNYEFQRLFGMGKGLYDQIVPEKKCRIYAPVGEYDELLPYLIRRLLENSANSSFVKKIANKKLPAESILVDPMDSRNEPSVMDKPEDLYAGHRKNSKGFELGKKSEVTALQNKLDEYKTRTWNAKPIIAGEEYKSDIVHDVLSPYDTSKKVGKRYDANSEQIEKAVEVCEAAYSKWNSTPVHKRAEILIKAADLLEERQYEAMAICTHEAGKTIADAIAEVREAIDFCRYYATESKALFKEDYAKGPTGETNLYELSGRGIFVCISPWNFPLAIFIGQVTAALATGNCVIAKPAEQTGIIASFAVKLLIDAGVPKEAIALLPGDGEIIGKSLLHDKRIDGVVFTGSVDTANIINRSLAQKGAPIIPLIAETGGQNAMIVDSSALIEQTVDDVVLSAFGSAGQRCSALRVLYIQEDVADEFCQILEGAVKELKIGSPESFATDVGPVIDEDAKQIINSHIHQMEAKYKTIAKAEATGTAKGNFVLPHVFQIDSILDLEKEIFGPVLHVVRFSWKNLDKVIKDINSCGYGLTFGIQTRIESRAEYIRDKIKVGNIYVNRNMTGATVGVQAFGGEALSGTGPKAGGPLYLTRFVNERVYTVNTTAAGGNRDLLLG